MVYCLYATDTNEISHSVIQKFVIMCFLHDSQVYSYANLLRAYTRTRVKLVRFRAACRTQQTKHLFISSSKLRFPHRIGRKPVDFRYEHVHFKQFHVNEMDTVLFLRNRTEFKMHANPLHQRSALQSMCKYLECLVQIKLACGSESD